MVVDEVPEDCSCYFYPYLLEQMVEHTLLDRAHHYRTLDMVEEHLVFEEGSCKNQEGEFLLERMSQVVVEHQ